MQFRLGTLLPGQFGLMALFVLTTMAAVAFAILRLPIWLPAKMGLLLLLWMGFQLWMLATRKHPGSPTQRVNRAVLNMMGELLMLAFFASTTFTGPQSIRPAVFVCFGVFLIGPAIGIWRAITAIRAALVTRPAAHPR